MPASMTDRVRDALLTAALFGGIGVALAQSPPQNSGNIESAQHPQVPGRTGVEEPTAHQVPKPGSDAGIFVEGKLNVPGAPDETSTTPSKVSQHNAQLDAIPLMARGPQLTDAQRKLIVDFAAASVVYRVVDDRTSRVVTQFPDDSTLRRRAYYRTLDTLKADAERASGHETDRQA